MQRAETLNPYQLFDWYFGFAGSHPAVYQLHDLVQLWAWARQKAGADDRQFVGYLRAALLKRAHTKAGDCTACGLHKNRFKRRVTFGDGSYENDPFLDFEPENRVPVPPLFAEIMLAAEGPGEYESRTGQPFTGYQTLAGSLCARECKSFEGCYQKGAAVPLQPCQPKSIRKGADDPKILGTQLVQIRTERAQAEAFPLRTAGELLDQALQQAGLWRESWNARQLYREGLSERAQPRPGTIAIANLVNCRPCKPKADASDGMEDRPPTKAESDACRQWLELQVAIIQPKVILALGNPAIAALTGMTDPRVLTNRNRLFPSYLGIPVVAEVHPAYWMRQNAGAERIAVDQLIESLKQAQAVAAGEVTLPWETEEVKTEAAADPFARVGAGPMGKEVGDTPVSAGAGEATLPGPSGETPRTAVWRPTLGERTAA
jgi:uracil-DNA glycosylase family 4